MPTPVHFAYKLIRCLARRECACAGVKFGISGNGHAIANRESSERFFSDVVDAVN